MHNPGLVWLTEADVRSLTTDPHALSYVMNLKLADPDSARAFVDAHRPASASGPRLEPWEDILDEATELARDAQILLMIGAWLLGLLAVASLSVLVGGRMADQTRRVGLLKAVGGTPSLVAAVLLAEYVLVAIARDGGRFGGRMVDRTVAHRVQCRTHRPARARPRSPCRPSASSPPWHSESRSSQPLFRPSAPPAPAPSARWPTRPRPPRRTGWLIAISARLPVPLLLALRVAARRPRRVVLGMVSIAITVSGIFVALVLNAFLTSQPLAAGYDDAQVELLRHVLLVVMVMVLSLAAVNAIFITWATVLDNRHSPRWRALSARPLGEVSTALAAAQVLPALAGAILGILPGGVALFAAINAITGGDSNRAALPPLWQLITVVLATVLVVAVLTAVPARLGGRHPVGETLQAELT